MSDLLCLIIVLVALQPILSMYTGKDVHEIYVQTLKLHSGLTIELGGKIGNIRATSGVPNQNASVDNAILAILGIKGIAFFKGSLGSENYIVVPQELGDLFKVGDSSRYVWSYGGGIEEKELEEASLKMVTLVEEYGKDYLKITQKSLDFNGTIFEDLDMTFGVVTPGTFYKEKSKPNLSDFLIINTKFSELKDKWLGKIFTPEFKHQIMRDHPLLSRIKGEIKEFSVTVFTGGKKSLVIDAKTDVADLNQTLVEYASGKAMSSSESMSINFEYAITFAYTPVV